MKLNVLRELLHPRQRFDHLLFFSIFNVMTDQQNHLVLSGDSDSEPLENFISKQCGWCKNTKPMKPTSKYCLECYVASYRICSRCKIPYPDAKYFSESQSARCNSCHKKYLKDREARESREKRRLQQQQQPSTASSATTSSAKGLERKRDSETLPALSSSSSAVCSADEDEANYRVVILQTMLLEALKSEMEKRKKIEGKKRLQRRSEKKKQQQQQ